MAAVERGWRNWKPLAGRLDCTTGAITRAISYNFAGQETMKWRIEAGLDYQEAIWSDKETLRLRAKVHAATGEDPMLLALPALRALAKKLGTNPGKQTNNSALWRECILIHAAINKL